MARPPKNRYDRYGNIQQWVVNADARRVPTFVIKVTGLLTKREILKRFSYGTVFFKKAPGDGAVGIRDASGREKKWAHTTRRWPEKEKKKWMHTRQGKTAKLASPASSRRSSQSSRRS